MNIIVVTADGEPVWYMGPFSSYEEADGYMSRHPEEFDDLVVDFGREIGPDIDVKIAWMNSPALWKE